MYAIETTGLTKKFGVFTAVDSLDLKVEEGMIYGFLGPNGAGKTTTIKMLCGLIKPDKGEIKYFGNDFKFGDIDKQTTFGYLPDVPGFYKWMLPKEFMTFSGQLFNIEKKVLEQKVDELLELVGLKGIDKKIGGFSRGMKQRLGIAQALIHEPKILFLDEPVSALDPIGRIEVMDIIEKLRGKTTVFFSTHIISDIERVCDKVLILNKGRLEMQDSIENIKLKFPIHAIQVEIDQNEVERFTAEVVKEPWFGNITNRGEGKLLLGFNNLEQAQKGIPAVVSRLGIGLKKLENAETSLEDVFIKVVSEK